METKTTSNACPSPEELARLLAGESDESERDRLLDHVVLCPTCSEEVGAASMLRDWSVDAAARLRGDEGRDDEAPKRGGEVVRPVWRRVAERALPIAATLFLVLGTGWWMRDATPIALDAPSGAMRGEIQAQWSVRPADETRLTAPPQRLELLDAPSAQYADYVFEIFDEEDVLLWRSRPQAAPGVDLPPDLLDQPGVYSWRVVIADGLQRRSGPTTRFILTDP